MFRTLKSLKDKYQNSSTWGEFFASYFIDLEEIYKRLEGKTETQQVEILKKALGDQQDKLKELIKVVAKQNEEIEELTNNNEKLKEQIKDQRIKELEESTENNELTDLLIEASKEADKLGKSIKETTASFQNLIEIRK